MLMSETHTTWIDLAVHNPHIGVTMDDTCSPAGRR